MKTLSPFLLANVVAVGSMLGCTEQAAEVSRTEGELVLDGTAESVGSALADSQLVRDWNQKVIATVKAKTLLDADIARAFAMVNVAMYDAVNGIDKKRTSALVAPTSLACGPQAAAAAQAAHDVLGGLFPDQLAAYDAQLATSLSTVHGNVARGKSWGAYVAAHVLAARASDGSTPTETQAAGAGPGIFRAAWSGVQYRNLVPFAVHDSSVYVSPGPPALTSVDYAAAFAEEKILGSAALPDDDKLTIFKFWSLGGGTSQPPGAWIQVAMAVTSARPLPLGEATRLFALLGMAMADTVAPTYQTKFLFRHWRPTTAIREADTDGNDNTAQDAGWSARGGGVGGTPEHWSGHSSFSAAAAETLAGFFCDDGIAFDLTTDSAPAGARHYDSFSAAMAEAGRSRIFGGLHFEFSNQQGLKAGRGVAREVLKSKLLKKSGQTHFGSCPL